MKTPVLLLKDIDVIKNITIRDFDSFGDRGLEFDEKELGGNLFHATGEKWRILRERLTGMRFAQTQIKVCMMKLLSQFRVEPSENTPKQLKCEPKRMLQEPKGGLRLNLIRRH
ncbi:hypothetical protein MSG28_014008 [Choristoneura fumiferana]|uniref:Uncharacterized protein n=1 Tax=Choristoneura fumiferana TaxID=7141 RepID=A0ACC0JFP9_CHOFU|nr:hypothetical protein MSG28_014008 [Choristoneura fumiferana]